jgi:hypothetical protein
MSKQSEGLARLERSGLWGLRFYKHFVPPGLKPNCRLLKRALRHNPSAPGLSIHDSRFTIHAPCTSFAFNLISTPASA